jgi:MFS family permease
MVSFLWIHDLTSYYMSGCLMGFGSGTIVICGNIIVSRWFVRNQGLAVGIMVAGASAGGALFPLIGTWLIETWGWRVGMAAASFGIWLIALPLYLLFAKENPTEADLIPEAPHAHSADSDKIKKDLRAAELDMSFRDLTKLPMFWYKLAALLVVAIADNGMTQNTILYLNKDIGLSPTLSALSLSIVFAFGVPAKIFAGGVFDRFSLNGLRIWYLALAASILLAFPVQGLLTMIIFSTVRGIAHGGLITGGAVITKQCFGPQHMNKVLPISTGFSSIGMALGPVLMSYSRDVTGSYAVGFYGAAALCVFGAVLALGVNPLYWNRLKALRGDRGG